jgi:hypothetical protein
MAKRKNHDKRTDLYAKAKNSRPENYAIPGSANLGMFIVKPASITRAVRPTLRNGAPVAPGKSPFVADPGGTKWLPPQEGK